MKELNILIGKRLREVREIFNEGGKMSTAQFAFLLSETRDKISNYENGRSAVPVKVLAELYRRGINPTYIITGEEEIFADNEAGKIFKEKIRGKILNIPESKISDDNKEKYKYLKAVAGIIPEPKQ